MIVETIVLCSESEGLVPCHARLFPLLKPLQLGAGGDEELHLHLLKFTHAENELSCHYLVAERLSYLRNTERNLHTTSLLHIQVVDKNTLSRLWAKIDLVRSIAHRAHLGREHQVELSYIGPVFSATDGIDNLLIEYYLLKHLQIRTLHCLCIALMETVALLLYLSHTW